MKARKHTVGKDGDAEISDYKVEEAGKFFAPFGCLIPAAGHLMLAIAERLAADRGLTYAFCDTDSMAFCDYYEKHSDEEFDAKVQEIADWFQTLNPYKHDVCIFGMEKVNYRLDDNGRITDKLEPLYCLTVSAKRYCLFNRDKQHNPIIRKASGHGLGDVMLPTGYKARFEHLAAPLNKDGTRQYNKLVAGSAAPLLLDMWYSAIIELQDKGTLDDIDSNICSWPELNVPHYSQTSLSTRHDWLAYPSLPKRRAFQFMTTLPAPILLNPTGVKVDPSKPKFLPRISKAIEVLPDGNMFDVIDVPMTRQETIEERVSRLLSKGGKLVAQDQALLYNEHKKFNRP